MERWKVRGPLAAYRADVEKLVRQYAPSARVIWRDNDLIVEGVERSAFDEFSQLFWEYRNAAVHGSGKSHALAVATSTSMTLLEPEEVERIKSERAINRAASRVASLFHLIELLVPKRLADEEIGDAMELIARLVREGRPRWQIYIKAVSAAFYVVLNAVRELSSSLLGKRNKA